MTARNKRAWVSALVSQINESCQRSPLLARLEQDNLAMETGRWICLELWPFIRELPANISAVREKLPSDSEAARNFLGQLADDERHYQRLFLKQCQLAGLSETDLAEHAPSQPMRELCRALALYSQESDYLSGLYAIVTAELCATAFCRYALPHYDRYFGTHVGLYDPQVVEEGLVWLRLHASPQPRHAIWLKRMLEDAGPSLDHELPEAVAAIFYAVLAFWQASGELTQKVVVA